ncbi:MAG TPA: NAD(P)-dependent alcohol dehydrogenase, partial [Gammaproteobacteria bacterium]|nr:NAD(P)-dependent alcohol dehydrogenase [Gammaproteobacteria bacterium]
RDLAIVLGQYFGGPLARDTIPLSDGAGEVVAIGAEVSGLRPGDRVAATFVQPGGAALGSPLDGVLAPYAVFDAGGLVLLPDHLSYAEGACLPCAGVTAWNALYGGKWLRPGETVLTLGTGGVSTFALQLAAAAGARVLATSSSDAKLERAQALGAAACINYAATPQWADAVLELTGGRGADHVVEVGGVGTLPQSYRAVAPGGEIALIGVLSREPGDLAPHALMTKNASLRGIFIGAFVDGERQFEALNLALAANEIHPVIDEVFDFEDAPQAYAHLASAKHFGKVVISLAADA